MIRFDGSCADIGGLSISYAPKQLDGTYEEHAGYLEVGHNE